jgi:hypothetical protein
VSELRYNLDENDIWLALFACGAIDALPASPRGRIRLGLPVGAPISDEDDTTILVVYVEPAP